MSTGVRRWALIALVLVAVLLGVWLQRIHEQPAAAPQMTATRSQPTQPTKDHGTASGLPVCVTVPSEVDDAVVVVRNNGPYLRPRDDGGSFGNRERLLPKQPAGYYREYTVEAPGQRFPGPRRLITGGQKQLGAEPVVWFYTADHYETFCELVVG